MTNMTRSEMLMRGSCLMACLLLAGCMGSGSKLTPAVLGPQIIVDSPDPVVPETPDETPEEEDEEDVVDVVTDIVTDILTTSVSVTTITSTSGS